MTIEKAMKVDDINKLLEPKSKSLSILDLKKTLKVKPIPGCYFVIQTANKVPWELLALYVNGKRITKGPIFTPGRNITVDLTAKVRQVGFPLKLNWMVYYVMNQPKSVAFFIKDGNGMNLGEKTNISGGKTCVSKVHTIEGEDHEV